MTCSPTRHHRHGLCTRDSLRCRKRSGAVTKDNTERLHTSVLIVPTAEKRHARRQRNNAAKKLQLEHREAESLPCA